MHFTQKRRSRLGCLGPQPGDGREEATISTPCPAAAAASSARFARRSRRGAKARRDRNPVRESRLRVTAEAAQGQSPLPTGDTCPSGHRSATQAAPAAISRFTRAFHGSEPTARPHLVQSGSPASGRARRGIASVWGPPRRLRSCLARPRTASAQPIPRYSRAQEPRSIPLWLGPASSRSRHSTVELSSRSLARSHSSPHSPRVARLGV